MEIEEQVFSDLFLPIHKDSSWCENGWVYNSEILGKGAFGTTYKACCGTESRCEYVAKIMNLKLNSDWAYEVEIQNKAAEEKITIPILDKWTKSGYVVLIMPALKITLYEYFLDPRTSDENIKNKLEKVMIKLRQLRKLEINHNDTSLWNVMIGYDEEVYIIDFGVSSFVDKEGLEMGFGKTAQQAYEASVEKLYGEVGALLDIKKGELLYNLKKASYH